jgi:predicted phage terminase large subunit-like protein
MITATSTNPSSALRNKIGSLSTEELAFTYFPAYIATQFPSYRFAPHNQAIASALTKVESGHINRLMIFMPPRHGKTMQVSEFFPSWYLGRNPESQIIASTYSYDRASDTGNKVRNYMIDPYYNKIFEGCALSTDTKSKNKLLTNRGGALFSVGTGGTITGRGANLFLIDDPVKSREDAESDISRKKLMDWYRGVAYTRLMPTNAIILIMTRWHFNDLAGFLLEEMQHENWAILKLPAVCEEEDDIIGRTSGQALWPSDYPLPRLNEIKTTIGTREWNAQYQQTPLPAEGGMINIEWFKKYDYGEYARWHMSVRDGYKITPPFGIKRIVISWDTAFKETQLNDPSAGTVWGESDTDCYLLNVINKRMNYPRLKRNVIELHEFCCKFDLGQVSVLIEDKASGQSLLQDLLADTRIPVIALPADPSKQVRMSSASPLIEAGKVHIPERAPWLVEYETQMARFPLWKLDDLVDSTSQYLNWFGKPRYVKNKKRLFWK